MTFYADIPGERLDAYVARVCEGLTRSAVQKLIEQGAVTRNGKPAKKNDKLNPGDAIDVTIPEPKEVDIEAKEIPLDIVYQDEDVVVINKPKGLVVHPAAGHQDDTLSTACSTPWAMTCPASTANCGPASSTASTRTPPACWRWRKTTLPTICWPAS